MAKEKEATMILYGSQYSCIECLSNENKGILLDSLFCYILGDYDRNTIAGRIVDGMARMAFMFMADRIDQDKRRYAEKCDKNRDIALEREQRKRARTFTNVLNVHDVPVQERKEAFRGELSQYVASYGQNMLNAFFDYWSEPTQDGQRMRCELEKVWSTPSRLKAWAKRDNIKPETQEQRADKASRTTLTPEEQQRAQQLREARERLIRERNTT